MRKKSTLSNVFNNFEEVKFIWKLGSEKLQEEIIYSDLLTSEQKAILIKSMLEIPAGDSAIYYYEAMKFLKGLNPYYAIYLAKEAGVLKSFLQYRYAKVDDNNLKVIIATFEDEFVNCIKSIDLNNRRSCKRFCNFFNLRNEEVQISLLQKIRNSNLINTICHKYPYLIEHVPNSWYDLTGNNLYRYVVKMLRNITPTMIPSIITQIISNTHGKVLYILYKNYAESFKNVFCHIDISAKYAIVYKLASSSYLETSIVLYNACSEEDKYMLQVGGFAAYYLDKNFDINSLDSHQLATFMNRCPVNKIEEFSKLISKDLLLEALEKYHTHNLYLWLSNYHTEDLVKISLDKRQIRVELLKHCTRSDYFVQLLAQCNYDLKAFDIWHGEYALKDKLEFPFLLEIIEKSSTQYVSLIAKLFNLLYAESKEKAFAVYQAYRFKIELILSAKIVDKIIEQYGVPHLISLLPQDNKWKMRDILEQASLANAFNIADALNLSTTDKVFEYMRLNRKNALFKRMKG